MNLASLMDEVASVLEEITGLRVSAYPPPTISPPAGVVSYPDRIAFDQTYGRGTDRIEGLPILLIVGKATARAARDKLAPWAAGGPTSVKGRMEAHTWQSCDDLTVTECTFDVVTIAGVDYLAAMFAADAVGPGEG
jgi:hypothetical protein